MRHWLSLPVIGLATVLSGCHGHSSTTSSSIIVPLTYTVGGSIAGLSGTIVLLDNGGDNLSLSKNGPFAFSVQLQPDAPYAVTIGTQPANQVCTVTNGSGTVTASVSNVSVVCSLSSTASDFWTWVSGASSANAAGVYGTQGTPAATTTPGARREPITWTDLAGNFWLFGGNSVGSAGMLNDLWKFTPSASQWTWIGGANTAGAAASYGTLGAPAAGNNPGAREGAAKWTDAAGNLWLFGGDSLASQSSQVLNDLWSYNTTTGLWTWVGGSAVAANPGSYGTLGVAAAGNLPPARTDAASWTDSAGLFWLFGGTQLNANGSYLEVFNDLWNYNPTSGLWTWVGGSNTPNAVGVYGTQGQAGVGNVPGARMGSTTWLDASGNFWLFGGLALGSNGLAQEYSDLWEYSPTSGLWTWVSGVNTPNAAGIYGTQRAGAAGNGPGARVAAVSWQDSAGNFWLFGGYGYGQQAGYIGNLNDLWEYSLGTAVWTWVGGSSSTASPGIYGTQGIAALGNTPGAREQAGGWVDTSDNFWLFGGFGFDASGVQGDLNDLWRFTQAP